MGNTRVIRVFEGPHATAELYRHHGYVSADHTVKKKKKKEKKKKTMLVCSQIGFNCVCPLFLLLLLLCRRTFSHSMYGGRFGQSAYDLQEE